MIRNPRRDCGSTGGEGFTLIELLVVVAIVGILAAMAIPSYLSILDRVRQRTTIADMRGYLTALGVYSTDNAGRIPDCDGDFQCLYGALAASGFTQLKTMDGWGQPYHYNVLDGAALTSYDFRSFGADGIAGANLQDTSEPDAVGLDIVIQDGQFMFKEAVYLEE